MTHPRKPPDAPTGYCLVSDGRGATASSGNLRGGSRTPETQQARETFAGLTLLSQHLAVGPWMPALTQV